MKISIFRIDKLKIILLFWKRVSPLKIEFRHNKYTKCSDSTT